MDFMVYNNKQGSGRALKNNSQNDWSEKWTDKVQIFSIHTAR